MVLRTAKRRAKIGGHFGVAQGILRDHALEIAEIWLVSPRISQLLALKPVFCRFLPFHPLLVLQRSRRQRGAKAGQEFVDGLLGGS